MSICSQYLRNVRDLYFSSFMESVYVYVHAQIFLHYLKNDLYHGSLRVPFGTLYIPMRVLPWYVPYIRAADIAVELEPY
jgi:hypothetical protein